MPKAMQRVTPAASPFLSVRHVPRQDSKNGRVAGIAWNSASMRPNGRGTENESPALQNLYMDLMQSGLRRKSGIGYIVL